MLIAGGGVAALEAALTLADVGEGRVRVELLSPEPQFWYRPAAVAEPFGLATVRHFDLGLLAARVGAGMTLGRLTGVDADRHVARTANGADLAYDALLIACGAMPSEAVRGALTFRGPADGARIRTLLEELEHGVATRVAFVVPPGSAWPMPAYELALMTADVSPNAVSPGPRSPSRRPSPDHFRSSGAPRATPLGGCSVRRESTWSATRMPSRTTAAPCSSWTALSTPNGPSRFRGSAAAGSRAFLETDDGFVQVDDHCAVIGVEGVFAAGDVTAFTIKQGGLAAQQAVVAGEAIAVLAGATLVPHPFRPVLRGLLLTGGEPAYLRHDLGEGGDGDWASGTPIWWPPTKIVGRRLSPFLAEVAGEVEVSHAELPSDAGIAVEAPIDREQSDTIAVGLGF